MPRLKTGLPSYRRHKQSAQAIVTLSGQDFLLGPHDTDASRREYDRVVAKWLNRGRHPLVEADAGLDMAELAARYWAHATIKYVRQGKPTAEQFKIKTALKHLLRLYENRLAADFSPLHLKVVRQAMIDCGWARRYINQQVGVLTSGHRRYAAARELGLVELPCVIFPLRRIDDVDAFVRRLVMHNSQRVKTCSQKLHEEAVTLDPDEAYERLVTERAKRSCLTVQAMELGPRKKRSKIGRLKQEMLDAVLAVLERVHRPTSDRKIFYELLNNPPRRNTSRGERFRNDKASYNDLCDLLTRARLEGIIPWEWIADETRPVTVWDVHRDFRAFLGREIRNVLSGYYRDLLQSQPHYVEVLAEKNTVAAQIRDVCARYCLPMTSGRGFCSTRPRWDLLQRYLKSGSAGSVGSMRLEPAKCSLQLRRGSARSAAPCHAAPPRRSLLARVCSERFVRYPQTTGNRQTFRA